MANKTLGTAVPKLTKTEKTKAIPKLQAMDAAIRAGDKTKAEKLYAELKPMMTESHRSLTQEKLSKLKQKKTK